MKLALISFLALLLASGSGIEVVGDYTGKQAYMWRYEEKFLGKTKTIEYYHYYHLSLKEDSSFTYKFRGTGNMNYSSRYYNFYCSGHWDVKGDTLSLNTKYRGEDFFEITESIDTTLPEDLVIVSLETQQPKRYCTYGYAYMDLTLGSRTAEDCWNEDTIYAKRDEVDKIKIRMNPIRLDYTYYPEDENSNVFHVKFHEVIGVENYFLENKKFLIRESGLKPIGKSTYHEIDDYFVKDTESK